MKGVRYNKEQFRDDFKRSHHASERSAYPIFKNALQAQIKPVIDQYKNYGSLLVPVQYIVPVAPMQSAYRKVYETVGLKFARRNWQWIKQAGAGKKAAVDFYNEKWRRLMIEFYENKSAERITEVTETTKEQVRQLLAKAEAQVLTLSEMATFMVNELSRADFMRNRALRIARTETTTAANQGAYISGLDSDYECGKSWLHIFDKNTRPSHRAMNEDLVIPYGDKFNVGGELMKYPGESGASAANIVSCRCCLVTVPLVDEDGLPILR